MNDPLEERLRAARGPVMPAEVEARIRKRIAAVSLGRGPGKARRLARRGGYGQLLLLAALLLTASWVARHQVSPVLRAAWERVHCVVDPGARRP